MSPDVEIFTARRVVTMDGAPAGALALEGDRFVAVGEPGELGQRYPDARRVDLGEAVIAPGFHDSHMHLALAGENLLHLDLSPATTPSNGDVLSALRAEAERTPPGGWLRGSGYNDSRTAEGRCLTRAELDEACPDHPVLVIHVAVHWAVANSRALALAGYDESSEAPPGGELGRDADGRLDGVLHEQALFDLAYPALARGGETVIPPSTPEDRLGGLRRAQERFHAAGITSVCDALVGPKDLELFEEADRRGLLTMRTDVLVPFGHYELVKEMPLGQVLGAGGVRYVGVKGFIDGAIGGRTALLSEPYEGRDDHGIQTIERDDLAHFVETVHADGHRLAVHANGDRAIAMLLDELESAARAHPDTKVRHRIEHCTVVNPELIERMRRLGAAAVPFGSYVHYHGGKLLEWYGAERVRHMFAHRSFLEAGVPVVGSSDFPCGPFEPLLALQSCVTRRGEDGVEVGPEQRLTPEQALALYTTAGAALAGQSEVKGRIAPGLLADFVVLGDDPLEVAPGAIGAIPVEATYVGGRRVH